MWIVEITNSKGTRYKYRERFMDPATGRYTIVSVTLNSNSRQAQRAAADMLRDKIREKTKTATERKAEKLAALTFYDVLDEWRAYVAPTVKTRTADNHKNYSKRIKKDLPPSLLFADFTPVMAENIVRHIYYTEMRSYSYSSTILTVMQRVMRYAKKCGYIDQIGDFIDIKLKKRPATAKELQKAANKFLNRDELKDCLRQLDAINHRIALAMEFIALTGLRCGELLALRVQDYDKENRSINVNGTIVHIARNGDDIQRGTPKNIYSYRAVHLNSRALHIIEWFIADNRRAALWERGRYKDKGYIFTTNTGNPYNIQYIGHKLRMLQIPGKHITTHMFRHTHISMLAEMAVPLKAIMQRVGHNDPNTTLSIYTHVTNAMTEEANRKIDALSV